MPQLPENNPGLGRDGLEILFPRLAAHIDRTPREAREQFLTKAFLLLADAHGGVDVALRCLEEDALRPADGRGSAS
jgi:hypothetical protein